MMTLAIGVERTQNRKVGNVAVTHASQGSCPNDCMFKNAGCYAEGGPQGFTTRRLNKANPNATSTEIALEEAKVIDALSGKRPLRIHIVGDCKTARAARIVSRAAKRYHRKFNQKIWTYTHGWRRVRRDHWGMVSVLASCESLTDIRQARARRYATALVVDFHPEDGKAYLKVDEFGSEKIIPCPEQTKGITCSQCRLCWDDNKLRDRGVTIAFAAHGNSTKRVMSNLHIKETA